MLLADAFASPSVSWNLQQDVHLLLQYPYMRHAFLAGAIVAIMGAAVGWFMVLRGETYAGHTLSMVAFPGAAGAALLTISPLIGLMVFCVGGALAIPMLSLQGGGHGEGESAVIGSIQAFALALGLLFVSLYHGFLSSITTFLFGTFTGISSQEVVALAIVAVLSLLVLVVIGRPLLFTSIDPINARVGGIPTGLISILFLVLLGLSVAEASQFTGALLAFALTVTPAAIAQQISARPVVAISLAMVLGVLFAWGGLAIAYFTVYPVGFFVTSLAFATYVIVRIVRSIW